MATEILATLQATGEARTHYVDFTNDLPASVSVISATAAHTPPSGSAVSPTVGVIASDIVPVTVPSLTVTGRHVVTVSATLSDGELIIARLIIPVQWDAARSSMSSLILELRGMTDAGSQDYTVGGIPYWTDKQLQTALDATKQYVNYEAIMPMPNYGAAGVITYTMYPTDRTWWEDSVVIQNNAGGTVGTASYSMELMSGLVTFTTNTLGSAYYITGYTYNLFQAAAEIWRKKASHYAGAYDFSTDNHSMKRSQLIAQARQMAQEYINLSYAGQSIILDRGDLNGC